MRAKKGGIVIDSKERRRGRGRVRRSSKEGRHTIYLRQGCVPPQEECTDFSGFSPSRAHLLLKGPQDIPATCDVCGKK